MNLTQSDSSPALRIEHLSKTFPGQRALDDVSFQIERGEVHALLGENGSGKSTLIKILSGYHMPDPGSRIYVGGLELSPGTAKGSFASGLRFVHQHLGVIPEFNAIENVAIETGYTRPKFINWKSQARYTRELLDRLDVKMDIRKPLRDCRPVERSAVAIARALRDDGEGVQAIVLDEPTSSLPAAETKRLFRLIEQLSSSGVAIIYITHRLDEVFEVADRVSVLRDGKLQGTRDMDGLTRENLVNLIVGRNLADSFENKPRDSGKVVRAGEVVRITDVCAERLHTFSLSASPGEIVGVVGIAGSGREDVARTLIGALPRESGQIHVDGKAVAPNRPRLAREAGIVLALSNTQPGSAISEFSVSENITLPALKSYKAGPHLLRKRESKTTTAWIKDLDIRPPRADQSYGLLSGGNQQKVILGKWLNCDPKVLVLDEPTAGVDVGARQLIYALIREKAATGIAVIVCSSDMEDFVSVASRAVVLRSGKQCAELEGEEITEPALLHHAVGNTENHDSEVGRTLT
jgi:ribose transport system ATP-binding protein